MLQESPLRKAGASWKNGTRDDDDEGLRMKPPSRIPEDEGAADEAERRSDRRPIKMNVEVVAILSINGSW